MHIHGYSLKTSTKLKIAFFAYSTRILYCSSVFFNCHCIESGLAGYSVFVFTQNTSFLVSFGTQIAPSATIRVFIIITPLACAVIPSNTHLSTADANNFYITPWRSFRANILHIFFSSLIHAAARLKRALNAE